MVKRVTASKIFFSQTQPKQLHLHKSPIYNLYILTLVYVYVYICIYIGNDIWKCECEVHMGIVCFRFLHRFHELAK